MRTDFSAYHWYALVYLTMTGEIVDEIPLAGLPQYSQLIDDPCSWSFSTQLALTPKDSGGVFSKGHLRGITDGWRFGIALVWGTGLRTDYIAQAGPITARAQQPAGTDQPPLLQLGGVGMWGLLNKIMQISAGWNGVSLGQTGGADTSYTNSLQGIAVNILNNSVGLGGRFPLPIDIPAALPGANVRNYFGYDLASAGQRLQELSQVIGGPDVLFKPYFSDNSHIRFQAQVGTPLLQSSGNPLIFDYPGEIVEILVSDDFTGMSTTSYVKGNGIEYDTIWATSSDTSLTSAGWPTLEVADISHADVSEQATLQDWANSDQNFNGRGVSTWSLRVKMDAQDTPFGSFDPGTMAQYNVLDHSWLDDGVYQQRLVGLQQGTQDFEYRQLVQAVQLAPNPALVS